MASGSTFLELSNAWLWVQHPQDSWYGPYRDGHENPTPPGYTWAEGYWASNITTDGTAITGLTGGNGFVWVPDGMKWEYVADGGYYRLVPSNPAP